MASDAAKSSAEPLDSTERRDFLDYHETTCITDNMQSGLSTSMGAPWGLPGSITDESISNGTESTARVWVQITEIVIRAEAASQ